jgi:hypothetical protein
MINKTDLAVISTVCCASLFAFISGRTSVSQVPSSPALVQTADSSVVKRREMIEEMLRRDERINRGHFSTYNVLVGTNTFNVMPLPQRNGFEIYQDSFDNEKKVTVRIGLDSSVKLESGEWEDFTPNAVLRYDALKTGDRVLDALLKQQEKTIYEGNLPYQRLKRFLTTTDETD